MPRVHKPRHKPIDVTDDQLQSFLDAGFTLCEGEVAPEPEDSGLTEAEIKKELEAVEKVTRKKCKDAKMSEADTEKAVAAAVAESKEAMGVE